MNPFTYGRVVTKDVYCPRPELESKLKARLVSAQNTYIDGERRTGKTSLIFETLRKLKSKKIIYVDLLEIRSIEDIYKRTLNGILKSEHSGSVFQNILKKTAALRPTVTFDPVTGLPSLSVDAAMGLKPDSLEGLLDLFTGSEFKNGVVVFDEFQDLKNLPDPNQAMAVMRTKIQFLPEIPFVFCGSIRKKMYTLFKDPDSPFYKSALPLEVGPIDHETFIDYISRRMKSAKINISPLMIEYILQLSHENPGDTQQLCAAVYDVGEPGKQVDEKTVLSALEYIFAEERKGYEAHLARITGIQHRCLVALARLGGKNTKSGNFLTMAGIRNPSTVSKALDRLEELKLLFTIDGEYRFVNPFFGRWLVYMNY